MTQRVEQLLDPSLPYSSKYIDGPGALLVKPMSLRLSKRLGREMLYSGAGTVSSICDGSRISTIRDMHRDFTQHYSISLEMNSKLKTGIRRNSKWRRKNAVPFHWSKGYKVCPHLVVQLIKLDNDKKWFKGRIPVTSLVYCPFQTIDLWCALTDEHMIPSGFLRLILMYQPEKIPVLPQTVAISSGWKGQAMNKVYQSKKKRKKPTFGARVASVEVDNERRNPLMQKLSYKFDKNQLLSIGDFDLGPNQYIYLNVVSARKIKGIHTQPSKAIENIKSLYVKVALQSTSNSTQHFPMIGVTKDIPHIECASSKLGEAPTTRQPSVHSTITWDELFVIGDSNESETSRKIPRSTTLAFFVELWGVVDRNNVHGLVSLGMTMIPLFPCVFTEGHIIDSYYPLCDENGVCLSELRIKLQYVEVDSPIGLQKQVEDANKVHRTIFDSLNMSKQVYYSISQAHPSILRQYGQHVGLSACAQRFVKNTILMNNYFRNIKRQTIVDIFNDYVNNRQCRRNAKTDQANISWEVYLNILRKVFMVLGVSISAYRLGRASHSYSNDRVGKMAVKDKDCSQNNSEIEGFQPCAQTVNPDFSLKIQHQMSTKSFGNSTCSNTSHEFSSANHALLQTTQRLEAELKEYKEMYERETKSLHLKLQREKIKNKTLNNELYVAEDKARRLQETLQSLTPKLEMIEHKYGKFLCPGHCRVYSCTF